MAAADVIRAMTLMQDEGVAEKVAAGDLSALEKLEFEERELELVQRVGAEMASEVQGFDAATSAAFEALAYAGEQGIPDTMEEELEEVIGFNFGGMQIAPVRGTAAKCTTCKSCNRCKKGMAAMAPSGSAMRFQMPGGGQFGAAPPAAP